MLPFKLNFCAFYLRVVSCFQMQQILNKIKICHFHNWKFEIYNFVTTYLHLEHCISNLVLHTLCKFKNFSAAQIFREIEFLKIYSLKNCQLNNCRGSNFLFIEFLQFYRGKTYQIRACKVVKMTFSEALGIYNQFHVKIKVVE